MITTEQLQSVGNWLSQLPVDVELDRKLKKQFPEMHFTCCMDDDVVAATPVYEHEDFNIYLIDSSNHCLSFTQDMAVATGLVVAEIEAE